MATPTEVIPLKPLVFEILLVLSERRQHGWALIRELERRGSGTRLLPGSFYRTLDAMLENNLIEEASEAPRAKTTTGPAPTRFFRLTPFGKAVARAEAKRLEGLVDESRAKRFLGRRRSRQRG